MKEKKHILKTILPLTLLSLIISTPMVCDAMHESDASYDASKIPGTVIVHSPASSKWYLGSPTICKLPDGTYIVSHDYFTHSSETLYNAHTHIYESKNRGKTWEKISEFQMFWGHLFYHRNALYIIGGQNEYDNFVIRKSTDGGHTWTNPMDENNGLLIPAKYSDSKHTGSLDQRIGCHSSPTTILRAKGRIWKCIEESPSKGKWGNFSAFVVSADEKDDLMKASSWISTNKIPFPPTLDCYAHYTWLEGNAVLDPKGDIYNMMRLQSYGSSDNISFLLKVSPDGKILEFDPKRAANIEGAGKKFTVRYDKTSKKYWSLVNWIPEKFRAHKNGSGGTRNTLALTSSSDLLHWEVVSVLLQGHDVVHDGFQYADWFFDGDDIVFVSRTAFFDGISKANNSHDSNLITFHRINDFKKRDMNSPLLK